MSSHLRRRNAVLPAVARFHGEEARGCAGPRGGRSRMARRLGVLVGSSCCGVAVRTPIYDSDRNHPMQRTRDSVLRYGESVGCELLNLAVPRLCDCDALRF